MGVEYREKILALARQRGPLLPADVARVLKVSSLFASAMLSEMVESKFLQISFLKIGGSPLYYLPGQTQQLEQYVSKLNPKDRGVFELLREKGVLRDSGQELLVRYSLRQLRDFARPLHVARGEAAELYWRFYALSEQEALDIMANPLKSRERTQQSPQRPVPLQQSPAPSSPFPAPMQAAPAVQPQHPSPAQQVLPGARPAPAAPAHAQVPAHPAPAKKPRARKERSPEHDSLYQKVATYCASRHMAVRDAKVLTKNRDVECIVGVPGTAGEVAYYCRARAKKTVSDTDLAAVFAQSTVRHMPAILFMTGSLSKKAAAALASYATVTVQQLS